MHEGGAAGGVLGSAASNRVNARCRVTTATSASISGMCCATEPTRSRRSNAASVPTSVQLVHARTKSTVLGRPWAFPGPATGKRSRQANGRLFRQHCRSSCHIFIDLHLRVSVRYFRQMRDEAVPAPFPQCWRSCPAAGPAAVFPWPAHGIGIPLG